MAAPPGPRQRRPRAAAPGEGSRRPGPPSRPRGRPGPAAPIPGAGRTDVGAGPFRPGPRPARTLRSRVPHAARAEARSRHPAGRRWLPDRVPAATPGRAGPGRGASWPRVAAAVLALRGISGDDGPTFARRVGITTSALARLEAGRRRPRRCRPAAGGGRPGRLVLGRRGRGRPVTGPVPATAPDGVRSCRKPTRTNAETGLTRLDVPVPPAGGTRRHHRFPQSETSGGECSRLRGSGRCGSAARAPPPGARPPSPGRTPPGPRAHPRRRRRSPAAAGAGARRRRPAAGRPGRTARPSPRP